MTGRATQMSPTKMDKLLALHTLGKEHTMDDDTGFGSLGWDPRRHDAIGYEHRAKLERMERWDRVARWMIVIAVLSFGIGAIWAS